MAAAIAGETRVISRYGVPKGGVDREQRMDVGTVGNLAQQAAGADRKTHLPAPDGGFAVGFQQVPDG